MKPTRLDEFSNPTWYRAPRELRDPVNYAGSVQGKKPTTGWSRSEWLMFAVCIVIVVLLATGQI